MLAAGGPSIQDVTTQDIQGNSASSGFSKKNARFEALHHPFCSPKNIKLKDSKELKEKIESSTAHAYDLVLNGLELGGGSLRIHQAEMQREVLRTVGLTDNQINEKFGFLIEAGSSAG